MPSNYQNFRWTGEFVYTITKQSWQSSFVENYINSGIPLPNIFNKHGRGYPDVSAVSHNCAIYTGTVEGIDEQVVHHRFCRNFGFTK